MHIDTYASEDEPLQVIPMNRLQKKILERHKDSNNNVKELKGFDFLYYKINTKKVMQ